MKATIHLSKSSVHIQGSHQVQAAGHQSQRLPKSLGTTVENGKLQGDVAEHRPHHQPSIENDSVEQPGCVQEFYVNFLMPYSMHDLHALTYPMPEFWSVRKQRKSSRHPWRRQNSRLDCASSEVSNQKLRTFT